MLCYLNHLEKKILKTKIKIEILLSDEITYFCINLFIFLYIIRSFIVQKMYTVINSKSREKKNCQLD
jgi:hypothetical protein